MGFPVSELKNVERDLSLIHILIPNIQARKRRIGDLAQEEAIFLRAKKEITREMEADFPAAAWFRDNY